MASSEPTIKPRIIIHGGAGNISRANIPSDSYAAYRTALQRILRLASAELAKPGATALDVATYAVSLFEDDPLFNAGRGAVFTRAGTNELEASVMVSRGHHKRGAGAMLLKHVKNPIKLVREILVRGDAADGGGAQHHVQLAGEHVEGLAKAWGLELVEEGYFFMQRRWEEHLKGLERGKGALVSEDAAALADGGGDSSGGKKDKFANPNDPGWDGREYLPQGTVGAVVLDGTGTLCAATSTGGLTNKLPGRIGDTPTLGAGYWAEEWEEEVPPHTPTTAPPPPPPPPPPPSSRSPLDRLSRGDIAAVLSDCLPGLSSSPSSSSSATTTTTTTTAAAADEKPPRRRQRRAVALSGTGNGDSFLRVAAARTVAAHARFGGHPPPAPPLAASLRLVAGPGGELQRSAGERWNVTGEGQGGIIAVELRGGRSWVGYDLNCGGMFRAWVDDGGRERVAVFADEDGLEGW